MNPVVFDIKNCILNSQKCLRLFVYSLSRRAKELRNALPNGNNATWDQFKKEFLDHFIPKPKYLARKKEIASTKQQDGEMMTIYLIIF